MNCIIDNHHDRITFLFKKNSYNIYLCEDCGTIMADVPYVKEQYEENNYYTVKYKNIKEIDRFWGFRFKYILNKISVYNKRNLLDFGAGNGYFTYLTMTKYHLACDGYEISDNEINFARNLFNIELKNDITKCADRYDIITLFNVIEHVQNPNDLLNSILKRLNKDGILIITTPNPNCFQTLSKGLKKWIMIMPPHHINLFSKKALEILLVDKRLKIIKYETLGTYFAADFFTKYGTDFQFIRRFVMLLFKKLNIGADHFIIAKYI